MSNLDTQQLVADAPHPALQILRMLWRDKFAFFAAVFLLIVLFCALFGPLLFEDIATSLVGAFSQRAREIYGRP